MCLQLESTVFSRLAKLLFVCSWVVGQMVASWRLDQQRPLSDASLCFRTLSGIAEYERALALHFE